ncbi:hypothetical protein [Cellulomonas fengjieae]|uniref:DUF4178 domain-containing protein n=1 Tax=Cellulomonas fengjieae TaxID=2819978 RepID=A0ABS3SNI0_9CELL|nr:hypothetical protein [Cellulomonas fengjieae]MBO3086525.1 hypothetical protein [Cellulomonas fengjieae]QVI66617.1 hypothetical protein KG102_03165 [Cellulomonas fengjieae]
MSVLDTTEVLDVAGYAAAVRRSLVDLGPELVDDLTDDLEADLAEALGDERHVAHGRGVLEQFGPPEEYAAELRAAAGLAPAESRRRVRLFRDPVEDGRRLGHWALRRLRAQTWWAPVEAFLIALRPVWWLLRGWVGFSVLNYVLGGARIEFIPREPVLLLVLALCIVVSVQWGRGAWLQSRSVSWVGVLGNATAVVLLLPVLATVQDQTSHRDAVYDSYVAGAFHGGVPTTVVEEKPMDGVVVDGMVVSNLFVYDAEGNPLSDVQVYDDRGRPVRTTFDNGLEQYWFPEATEPWSFVSRVDSDGRARWNVYPLQGAPTSEFTYDDDGMRVLPTGTSPATPPWPFAKAPALEASADAEIAAEGATPSPTPTTAP